MLGRSLPPVGPRQVEEAKSSFYSIVCSDTPRIFDPTRKASIMRFMKRFGLRTIRPEADAACMAPSASYDTPRREGGRSQEMCDYILASPTVKRESPKQLVALPAWKVANVRLRVGSELMRKPYHLKSRSVVIREYGYKTRIVSCSDALRTHSSEAYRKGLFKALSRLPCCRKPLKGDAQTYHFGRVGRRAAVYSADLSAATDRLDHGVLTDFCECFGVPPELVIGGTVDDRPMYRGTLMGIPCSWPMLSLVHAWAIWRSGIPLTTCHLKGDDNIALWTSSQRRLYNRRLPAWTGMTLNATKSFVSEDAGTFCEKFYFRQGDNLHLQGTVSLRALLDRSAGRGIPFPLKVRQYLWSLASRCRWKTLFLLQQQYAPNHVRAARASLPYRYGGLDALPRYLGFRVGEELSWLFSAVHDGKVPDPVLRRIQLPLFESLPHGCHERVAAERESSACSEWSWVRGSLETTLLDATMALKAMFAWSAGVASGCPRPTPVSYHGYERLVSKYGKLDRRMLIKHTRLRRPTVLAFRGLLKDLIPTSESWRVNADALRLSRVLGGDGPLTRTFLKRSAKEGLSDSL
jgi:hypothetical protein